MTSSFLSYADAFQAWLGRQREQRRAALTRRFIDGLPDDIRKDIGWPGETARLEAADKSRLVSDKPVALGQLACPN